LLLDNHQSFGYFQPYPVRTGPERLFRAILMVVHDRYFIEPFCQQVWQVKGKGSSRLEYRSFATMPCRNRNGVNGHTGSISFLTPEIIDSKCWIACLLKKGSGSFGWNVDRGSLWVCLTGNHAALWDLSG
jgi:hypothetical protein